jgi:hypothetical protein
MPSLFEPTPKLNENRAGNHSHLETKDLCRAPLDFQNNVVRCSPVQRSQD